MPVKPANLADPVVTFQTSLGVIETELLPAKAPVTVANFLRYVGAGFYDNVIFHRLYKPTGSSPAIVAQAGLLATDGSGCYGVKSPLAAAISLESQNGLSNTLGAMAMARTSEPNSAAAQFYFNTTNNAANFDYQSSTNPGYAVFGKTLVGLDVLSSISQSATKTVNAGSLGTLTDFPAQDIVIQSARATQYFSGKRADYTLTVTANDVLVSPVKGAATSTSVLNINRLQFKDKSLGVNEVMSGVLATTAVLVLATQDGQSIKSVATADEMYAADRADITLDGALGNDTLVGGSGNDTFAFSTTLNAKTNVDSVVRFDAAHDHLLLARSVFTAYTTAGALPATDFVASSKPVAKAANQHLLYNTKTGDLAYDADGNGKLAPVVFAKLVGVPVLTADNLTVGT
jgi:peptidyl-prolyl cis-trans isomerase A (cyclophilin A)